MFLRMFLSEDKICNFQFVFMSKNSYRLILVFWPYIIPYLLPMSELHMKTMRYVGVFLAKVQTVDTKVNIYIITSPLTKQSQTEHKPQ